MGRYAAREASLDLGIAPVDVPTGAHREPLWPPGVTGSITHAAGFAAAAVARVPDYLGLGIDIEQVMERDVRQSIEHSIITPSEAACLDLQDGDFSRESLLTLIFSAKESFFKATFPAVGRYFGFEAIEFSGINVQEQTLSFDVIETLSPALHLGHRVVLRFGYLDPTTVMTSFTWRRNPLDNR